MLLTSGLVRWQAVHSPGLILPIQNLKENDSMISNTIVYLFNCIEQLFGAKYCRPR